MEIELGKEKVLKCLAETRWSAHADAVEPFVNEYASIKIALGVIIEDLQLDTVKQEARGLCEKMDKLETVLLAFVWNDLLKQFKNKTTT
jgi:hypothetical protein